MTSKPRPKVVLVAAIAKDGTIGKEGGIPWRHPEDTRFFKEVTTGTALVMGRKTYVSIGRALPGRDNIVVTRDPATFAAPPGVLSVGSVEEAYDLAVSRGAKRISVIGGGEIYAMALSSADEMVLTYVPEAGGGDVFFPKFDAAEWTETARETRGEVEIVRYARR
jgi:dihydrofolate reductase